MSGAFVDLGVARLPRFLVGERGASHDSKSQPQPAQQAHNGHPFRQTESQKHLFPFDRHLSDLTQKLDVAAGRLHLVDE